MGIFDRLFGQEKPSVLGGSEDQRKEAATDPEAKKIQDAIFNYEIPEKKDDKDGDGDPVEAEELVEK